MAEAAKTNNAKERAGDTVLLVDYENIQQIDGALLPDDLLVRIFIGGKQSKVRREILQLVSERRGKVTSVFIDGQASNALDFHIAFYLGEYSATMTGARFLILSKDKGYDALVRHMTGRGIECERIADLSASDLRANAEREGEYAKTAQWLHALSAKSRPTSRKALRSHVASFLQRKPDDRVIASIVDRLVADGLVNESGKKLEYSFASPTGTSLSKE